MKIQTLEDLFYEELRELYDEEQQLVDALPKMSKQSASERLREALEHHVEQTRGHVRRLEECFRDLGQRADSQTANGMKGLIKEGERISGNIEQSALRDAALIGAAKRVEHYEIAAYTGTISFARLLGHENIAGRLEQTLQEEREADSKLTQLAETTVNQEALKLGSQQRA